MSRDWRAWFWKSSIALTLGAVTIPWWESIVLAQIIRDETLGAESSVVTPDNIKGLESDRISGGAIRGSNLFHSFREFNIGEGKGGYFENPAAIENIFSRVTGSNPSNILGTLGVLGDANLFFLNPNGILFGPNASLDLRGSFLGTTANSIVFPDGKQFSAANPEAPPILTVNVKQPIGLQFEGREEVISNQGLLAVDPGQNLALVGGDITLDGGSLIAPGGRVELGGLSAAGEIGLSDDSSLSFPDEIKRADVTLTNAANVIVGAGGGGSITVNARNIELSGGEFGGSLLLTGIAPDSGSPAAQAGDIILNAKDTITVSQGSTIANQVASTGVGDSGGINITTANLSLTQGGAISASIFGEGDGGTITIKASDNISADGETQAGFPSGIFSQVGGVGNSGGINITTANLSLTQGGRVSADTFGEGDGGTITIKASDNISADGETQAGLSSGIFGGVAETGEGNAGGINITTANLSLTQGSQVAANITGEGNAGDIIVSIANLSLTQGGAISASIFGEGDAGEITINASDTISLEGEDREGFNSGIFSTVTELGEGKAGGINITTANLSLTQGGLITASTFGVGDAGGINITTANLSLTQGGAIGVSTLGEGDAGEITINASDTISAEGKDDGLDTGLLSQVGESGIFSRVAETGEGNAGGIILNTTNLSLTDEAKISVDSLGRGKAGNLTIRAKTLEVSSGAQIAVNSEGSERAGNLDLQADSLTLDTGTITAETASNQGGDINLTLSDLLTLRNNSQITATAGTDEAGGDGGNITIDAPFVIAFPNEDSNIQADAFEGDGGNIIINTNGIFGLELRDEETSLSDITASSEFGQQGEVEINTSAVDPTRGLNNLPQEAVEAEVAQGCQTVGGRSKLEFFDIGRGGLPPNPDELLSSEIVIAEWIPLDLADDKVQEQTSETSFTGDEIKDMTLLRTFLCQQ